MSPANWVGARWNEELGCLEAGNHPQEPQRLDALEELDLVGKEEVRGSPPFTHFWGGVSAVMAED